MRRPKIVLIDDEAPLRDSLGFAFAREGFDVAQAKDGASGLALVLEQRPDVVLLDLMLPGLDGVEVCRRIREASNVPIIMLTARDQADDKLRGFDVGADDYVTKPFNTRELIARVRALLRRDERARAMLEADEALLARIEALAGRATSGVRERRSEVAAGAARAAARAISVGALRLDLDRREATVRDRTVALSEAECAVLETLARAPGRVVTRTELLGLLGGTGAGALALLEAHVRTLRAKLERDAANPELVITVPGIGYQLAS